MSGEIAAKLQATGLTIKACVVSRDRTKVWNGSAFAVWATVSLTAWRSALVACTEQSLSTAEASGVYVGDLPAGIAIPISALFYSGASPLPGDVIEGKQELTDLDLFVETGAVVTDAGNSATTFKTTLAGSDQLDYTGRLLVFNAGNAAREPRRITAFNTGTGFVTLASALSAAPASGDAFSILGYIEV